ncbi:Tat pathway signal sequence domain protein [Brevundimonas pondensis]|uniref:Tat pathway signal sequence domain protein n=1 Tax=Brevundimonas pondensis TaxID=2774189 RepID=A0ABX7SJL9_9CAUL|nr:Tat pathway signal sequence domain protein [Brevundimonas pondensis]QTC87005.1 Tat pathway signal sequence domain protein [Brevundimonas pondensis]
MRRVLTAFAALSVAAMLIPQSAVAQSRGQRGQGQQQAQEEPQARPTRIAPLSRRANAGPCPYVKVLYDAARYVELADFSRPSVAGVGFTGEIEGVSADCVYREADPIRVDMNILFNLGKGAQASGDQRTYRYWVAVTERNTAVLAKEYFDLPVNFEGQATASVQQAQTIVIPRAEATTSGNNFEILVGFEITPEMADFNRSGSRFRVTAGQTQPNP